MEHWERHQQIWRLLYRLLHRWIERKFNLTHEDLELEGPLLIIPNHSCAWDPLLVAMCLPRKQAYFVASEHIFRLGFLSRLLERFLAPIPRRKASSGADTVKAILRHLKAGHSVCLFAEGDQCWAGRSGEIFPATGKLARSSGATLVTVRVEGGYLSLPRWGKGVRRGKVQVRPVNIYPPETLRGMTPAQIDEAINRDIHEDAWQRQREWRAAYRGKRRAEGMERALFLCPKCGKLGTLQSEDDRIFCSCGLRQCFGEEGFLEPPEPFGDLAAWDAWQLEKLRTRSFPHAEDELFSDVGVTLTRVSAGHREETLASGTLRQTEDALELGDFRFPLGEVHDMAMVLASRLLFTHGDVYYQLRADSANLRKYLEFWKTYHS